MIGRAALLALLATGAALVLTACESTQDKSKRLSKQGTKAFKDKGLTIARVNPDVKVLKTWTLTDENGTASVVEVRNASSKVQVAVPVLLDVKDPKGASVFRNDAPGIEASLTQLALLEPRQTFLWVNDQVTPSGTAAKSDLKVGVPSGKVPAHAPRIELTPPKLQNDTTSGIAAVGFAINHSQILQRKLVVYGVARKGGRVVAAGRSQIEKVKPGKRGYYKIFFIGNPRGARLEVAAPPTVLR